MYQIYHQIELELKYNRKTNISKIEQFIAYVIYAGAPIAAYITAFLKYRRVYQNYLKVLVHLLKGEYPIDAILRNGNHISLHNRFETSLVTYMEETGNQEYKFADNKVTISTTFQSNYKRKTELFGATSSDEVIDIFFKKTYHFLPVQGNTVVDIGANIGDSAIYFALGRASKVLAIEPFPKNYEIAKKNIEANSLNDKIALQLAGCAAKRGDVTVDPLYQSDHTSRLTDFGQGIKVPILTLQDILIEYKLSENAVLKMNCEGCEYDSILFSTCDTLRSFSHIQLEYHNGYQNLKKKLENCGFHVVITRPLLVKSSCKGCKKIYYSGQLYATRS
jgi:FkbM family methyltransferase